MKIMQTISVNEFVSMSIKHGYIFFFSMDGYCGLCKQYESELSKYDIPKLIKVDSKEENELMGIGIGALPCTRIYDKEEKVIFERYGVLYSKQIQELLTVFRCQ